MRTSLPPGQTLTLHDMQMYYLDAGEGEPLLLLHGYTGASTDWAFCFDELASQHRAVLVLEHVLFPADPGRALPVRRRDHRADHHRVRMLLVQVQVALQQSGIRHCVVALRCADAGLPNRRPPIQSERRWC